MGRYSPLRVRVFQTCRLRYRYQYVDKIPARLRIRDTAGSLVHRVLCDFFSKIPMPDRRPELLVEPFDSAWTALSPRYLFMEGVEALRSKSRQALERFAREHDLLARPFLVEPYLQVEIAPEVTLFGRVDRIDEEADRSLHVIDYKTDSQPGEIDAGQLRLYAIMVEASLGRSVSRISFWHLDDGVTWTDELNEEDKGRIRAELLEVIAVMNTETQFPPNIDRHCSGCPYLHVCSERTEIALRRQLEGW